MASVLVMGTGAVGGFYGLKLSLAGNDVFLVARGKNLDVLRRDGLHVESRLYGTFSGKLPVSDDPASFGVRPGYILFGVKSYDTEEAIEQIRALVGDQTQILAIQNGVENYDKLVAAFGENRVIRGFCRIGAEMVAPGRILQVKFGEVYFAEDDGSRTDRIEKLVQLFTNAGIPIEVPADIRREVWLKFIWNGIFNMLTALLDKTIVQLYATSQTEDLMHRMAREIVEVGQAEGVNIRVEDAERIIGSGRGLGEFLTSTHQDRRKGKRLEFDAFTGAIVRFGERHGIPTPEFRTIDALFRAL